MLDRSFPGKAVRFAGQFVLRSPSSNARATRAPPEDFADRTLTGGFQLWTQRSAPIHTAGRHADVAVVGTLLNPWAPNLTDQNIVDQLAACSTFAEVEGATDGLAGRWLLFVSIGGEGRLYPDATGSRAVFHAGGHEQVTAASQPGLLKDEAGTHAIPELLQKLWSTPYADAWPGSLTPYEGTRQLLPNHYLDLSSGSAVRFWPRRDVPEVGLEDAACVFADTLTGVFRAMARRGGIINLPITGGIDSRMLLACAREIRSQVWCFTVVDTASPLHDVLLPLRLFSKLGLNFRFVRAHGGAPSDQLLRLNTGGVWRDPYEHRISAFRASGVHVLGTVSEVCRCYYYPRGQHPEHVDGTMLARLAGWGDEASAIDAYAEWLAGVPDSNVTKLDLFYWECRLGNWAALDAMALDGYAQSLSPFNCRALLEVGLGVDTGQRRAPYALQRRVCDLAAPELHDFPVNETWLGSLGGRARGAIPRSARSGLKQGRRYMAGAPKRT